MCTIQPEAAEARELVCIFSERVAVASSPSPWERSNRKGRAQAHRGEGGDFGGEGDGPRGTAGCVVLRGGATVRAAWVGGWWIWPGSADVIQGGGRDGVRTYPAKRRAWHGRHQGAFPQNAWL